MDVVKVDNYWDGTSTTPTYLPIDLIEGYDSMIWTERYRDPGEFEMKTYHVNDFLSNLPLGSMISHLDTDETAMVETHSIENDQQGVPMLTLTGRTLDFFTENRDVWGPYQKKFKMAQAYTPMQAVAVLLWNGFDNSSGVDVTHSATGWTQWQYEFLNNVAITNSLHAGGTGTQASVRRWLDAGVQLDAMVLKFLEAGALGIRTQRPTGQSSKVLSVGTTSATYGNISSTSRVVTELAYDIYDGLDRTSGQTTRTPVIFSVTRGDVLNPKYLFSIKDYKTYVTIDSSTSDNAIGGWRNSTQSSYGSFDRRVLWVDGGSPAAGETVADFQADLPGIGSDALAQHRRLRQFDGDISPNAPYAYKKDYWLGDLVTMLGQYNLTQDMQVTEHVRTEDASGDRGYPTLTAIADD